MSDPIAILTSFVLLIVVGILVTLISKKVGISNILFLIIIGGILAELNRWLVENGTGIELFVLPEMGMVILSIIALALLVFEGASKFHVKMLDDFSVKALTLICLIIGLNVLIVAPAVVWLFFGEWTLVFMLYAAMFAIIVAATDPAALFYMLKGQNSKSIDFLEVESIFNTPIIVILPFLLLDFIQSLQGDTAFVISDYGVAFVNQVIVGLGTGVLIGIVFLKTMKKFYDEEVSPLGIIAATLLAYVLAENLMGNGVISVAVLGFMFGHTYVARKEVLQKFNTMLGNSLEIIVYLLLGFIVSLNLPYMIYLKTLVVFLLIILARWIGIWAVLKNGTFNNKEKWFMTLNMPKGVAVAVMVFSLSLIESRPLTELNNVLVIIIIYSVLLSTVVNKFSSKFINLKTS